MYWLLYVRKRSGSDITRVDTMTNYITNTTISVIEAWRESVAKGSTRIPFSDWDPIRVKCRCVRLRQWRASCICLFSHRTILDSGLPRNTNSLEIGSRIGVGLTLIII